MKREILFRVWDKEDKRMITHEQDFIPLKVTSIGVLRLNPHHVESFWEIMPIERFELMQSTGMQDATGNTIYEGDIVNCYDNSAKDESWRLDHESIGVIEYAAPSFVLKVAKRMYPATNCSEGISYVYLEHWCNAENILILGDIHNSPEKLPVV